MRDHPRLDEVRNEKSLIAERHPNSSRDIRVRRDLRSLSLVLVAFGCAGPGTGSAPAPVSSIMRVSGPAGVNSVALGGNDPSAVRKVPYPVDKVWRVLPAVFDSIGIPLGMLEPTTRTMGNEAFKVRGRLKGVPLSRYIDCGNSTQIGPNADSYDVVITMIAEVRPAEAGASSVRHTFSAVARPSNFAQDYSQCASKSILEPRFMAVLTAALER